MYQLELAQVDHFKLYTVYTVDGCQINGESQLKYCTITVQSGNLLDSIAVVSPKCIDTRNECVIAEEQYTLKIEPLNAKNDRQNMAEHYSTFGQS